MLTIEPGCKVMLLSPASQGGKKNKNVAMFKGFFWVDDVTSVQDQLGNTREVLKLVDMQERLLWHFVDFTDVVHVGQDHTKCRHHTQEGDGTNGKLRTGSKKKGRG